MTTTNLADKQCMDRIWITPESVLRPVREYFGERGIELDPATEPTNPAGASRFFTVADDGLARPWSGNVFLNPPYGKELRQWLEKLHREVANGVHAVVLLPPTRTETAYWQEHVLNERLAAVCYVRKRVPFLRLSGEPAASNTYGSVLHLYNGDPKRFARCLRHLGKCVRIVEVTG